MHLNHSVNLGRQMDMERVQAEVEAKFAAEQQNEDVMLRKIKAQGEEDRRRTQEAINTVLAHLASAVYGLVSDPRWAKKPWTLEASMRRTGQLLETYLGKPSLVRETSRVGTLRSTNHCLLHVAKCLISFKCKKAGKASLEGEGWSPKRTRSGREEAMNAFRDVVLAPDLKEQVLSLAVATRNAKRNGAPYRHLLLYGPPGTGKTMVAKRLVSGLSNLSRSLEDGLDADPCCWNPSKRMLPRLFRHLSEFPRQGCQERLSKHSFTGTMRKTSCFQAAYSGMDCAVMSGGDVAPLGKNAVTELHGLFRWAAKSPRGLLLFIDEAEAFLGKRSRPDMSEGTRNALNALLYNTGSASRRLMMVLATNRAEVNKHQLEVSSTAPGPGGHLLFIRSIVLHDRTVLLLVHVVSRLLVSLSQYFHKYCATGKDGSSIDTGWGLFSKLSRWWRGSSAEGLTIDVGVDECLVKGLAEEVQGFSGREVEKLMLGVQSCAYGSEDGMVTADMIKRVATQKAKEHGAKVNMRAATEH
ncbi:unnamed protein product [Ectocarpus sp. CCAP 1310/34]|nr:unnamed protein product [Ectocarpus sp. CCAP 1310/34]